MMYPYFQPLKQPNVNQNRVHMVRVHNFTCILLLGNADSTTFPPFYRKVPWVHLCRSPLRSSMSLSHPSLTFSSRLHLRGRRRYSHIPLQSTPIQSKPLYKLDFVIPISSLVYWKLRKSLHFYSNFQDLDSFIESNYHDFKMFCKAALDGSMSLQTKKTHIDALKPHRDTIRKIAHGRSDTRTKRADTIGS